MTRQELIELEYKEYTNAVNVLMENPDFVRLLTRHVCLMRLRIKPRVLTSHGLDHHNYAQGQNEWIEGVLALLSDEQSERLSKEVRKYEYRRDNAGSDDRRDDY